MLLYYITTRALEFKEGFIKEMGLQIDLEMGKVGKVEGAS